MGYRARAVGFGTECEATKKEIAALRARFLARSKTNAEESVSHVSARFEAQTLQDEETGMEGRRAELTVNIAELQNLTAKWRKRVGAQRADVAELEAKVAEGAKWVKHRETMIAGVRSGAKAADDKVAFLKKQVEDGEMVPQDMVDEVYGGAKSRELLFPKLDKE